MRKAEESKSDPYLALLDWRNTPTEILNSSPAQRLFNRRTKTQLPTSNKLLKPWIPDNVKEKLRYQKAKQSIHYNKGTKELEELRPGDIVRLQPRKSVGKTAGWQQAKVEGKVDTRSYQIRTEDGRVYRRNRRHLRRTRKEQFPSRPRVPLAPPASVTPAVPPVVNDQEPREESASTNNNDDQRIQQMPVSPTGEMQAAVPPLVTTRSGRVVKTPVRFQ